MPTLNSEIKKSSLIIFVKPPIPGDVKTRLIPHLSGSHAAELYKCFVKDILSSLLGIQKQFKLHIAYQHHPKVTSLSWLSSKQLPDSFKQEGRSLGERLIHAFGIAFGRGYKRVVIIGADSPTLPPHYIQKAFQALNEADVVLGPATDGGYYLVGLSRPCMKLFEDVSWSSDQVFERTASNAQHQGYTLRVLPTHYDIDTIEDLHLLHNELGTDGRQAPQTRKFINSLLKTKSLSF